MVRTPQTLSITLAAGATYTWPVHGSNCRIMSMSAGSSLLVGFNTDALQRFSAGVGYPCKSGSEFHQLRFQNDTGGATTVVVAVSDEPLNDQRFDTEVIQEIADNTALVTPAETPTLVPRTTVPVIGGTPSFVLVMATNPSRKWFCLEAGLGNAGNIYLGFADTLDATNSFNELMAGGFCRESLQSAIYACSDNGTETIKGYEIE